jgi:c-di-AMP phosphodiesterase-like protein
MSRGPSVWFDTRVYLAVSAALLLVILFYNKYVAVIGAILLYILYLYGRERHLERQKELSAYLDLMCDNIGQAARYALQNLPLAIAIVDEGGKFHWRNSVFADWLGDELAPGDGIARFWPDIDLPRLWGKTGFETFHARGKHYQAIYKPLVGPEAGPPPLMIFSLIDITASETAKLKCEGAMPVLAYIQIDNVNDVLKGLSESQRAGLLAEVNRRLSEWVGLLEGILKKYGDDSYIAVFDRTALDAALADKFDILDSIRTIHGGNRIPVTLSMGVAADEATIAALGQRAQAGLDLALGRGGDQAVVHIAGKVQFYGGKTKTVEKSTRVKARIVAQAIRDIIADAPAVLVMGHAHEDYDSLGAALGIARMAGFLGKPAHIVVSRPGAAVDKLEEFLVEYQEYGDLFLTPAKAEEALGPGVVLFVVDTHRPALVAAPSLLGKAEKIVVIDHHRRAEDFVANPLLVYLEPSASSTSELVTELITYFDDKLDLTRIEASASLRRHRRRHQELLRTDGVRTFDAAPTSAGPAPTPDSSAASSASTSTPSSTGRNHQQHRNAAGGVAIATYTHKTGDSQIAAAQAADMLLNIEGINVSFVLYPIEGGVAVSARSQGDINVQLIVEELGGGGHQTVAGAQIKGVGLDEVKSRITALVAKYIKESENRESNPPARS